MVQSKEESVETFAILPYAKFASMEKRFKKAKADSGEDLPTSQLPEPQPTHIKEVKKEENIPLSPTLETVKKKDVKTKYRATQIKKLIQHIEKKDGAEKITSLDNLDELIKCALGTGRKYVPNEETFFNWMFLNNLSHFIKNQSKISKYFNHASNWYEV